MDMQNVVSYSEIAGALSVPLSLIALIVTVRQNTQFQRAVVVDSLSAAITAINVPGTESPALGDALSKAMTDWGSATRDQRIVAHYFLFSFFKLSENAWYQHKAKVLDDAQWIGWETLLRKYYHSEGVQRVWWPNRRHTYSPDFIAYLSQTGPVEGVGNLNDIFDYVRAPA